VWESRHEPALEEISSIRRLGSKLMREIAHDLDSTHFIATNNCSI
jgi:hypothetical protein